MSAAPAVSVIVPARDAEATLPAALESVLAQDYGGEIEVDRRGRLGDVRDAGPRPPALSGRTDRRQPGRRDREPG